MRLRSTWEHPGAPLWGSGAPRSMLYLAHLIGTPIWQPKWDKGHLSGDCAHVAHTPTTGRFAPPNAHYDTAAQFIPQG